MITFGLVVGGLITNGLVTAKANNAKRAVDQGSDYAVNQLNSQISNPNDGFAGNTVRQVVRTLAAPENGVTIAILPGTDPSDDRAGQLRGTSALGLPTDLKEAVQRQGSATARRRAGRG